MRQKLQNSKGYSESPEFLASTWALLSLSLQVDVNYITSSLITFTQNMYIYIYTPSQSHHCAGKDGIRLFRGQSVCDFISQV